MILAERIELALVFAACKHEGQTRKGGDVPYITHPVAVALLVHEQGGNEDEVIGALLHDTVEDCGGRPVLDEIRTLFGETVAAIVDGMTDSYEQDKEHWEVRKQRYLDALAQAGPSVRLVAVCDKLHNVRSILTDYEQVGAAIWKRFRGGKQGSLWYYRSLVEVLRRAGERRLLEDLDRSVRRLEELAAAEH